ncbi:alpha/beta hydrolase [Massilia norwichensis]|uniref:Alpha/beta hydrolase-fold protein n=1 Tax=Massilia norwichensis TaxID=1442366 RepID=A0ABT2A6J9_9BURK|nr:alpha/beta hydrolase-fold protein [Massilia norwichensis]MCS0589811.1 alpha/beta hydrolase-fold protein [Massilia norwichensis]
MKRRTTTIAALGALLALTALTAQQAGATTVRVHYPAGKEGIGIIGNKGPMSWSKGVPAQRPEGPVNVWTYTWPDELGEVQMKPTLGEEKISIGGAYTLAAGSTVDIYPFFGAPFGKLTIVKDFASPQLNNKRALRIWLPPSYAENPAKRYPVLYMHDGQNLFDARTAAYGVEWGIDETMNRLIAMGKAEEAIVVGIDNTPERIAEYTPCCDPKYGGGKLDAYGAFVVDTVKPYIDRTYRTLSGKENTAIMGSSLGGIASVAIAQRYPDIFSKAGGVSSSFWWNNGAMIAKLPARVPVKFYLDAGTVDDGLPETTRMLEAMRAKGYRENEDLLFFKAEGARHNETSWAARVEKPLLWFFPWGSTKQ